MKNTSSFLGAKQSTSLSLIIHQIVQISDPEKILLLAASFDYQLTENIFMKNPVQQYRGNRYNLLILSEVQPKNSLSKLELKLMERMLDHRNVQFAVIDIIEFNKEVETGDSYWRYILLNAMLSYDKGQIPLANPYL